MAQRFRALAALLEDLGSIPSIQMVSNNLLKLQLQGIMGALTYMEVRCSDTLKLIKKIF